MRILVLGMLVLAAGPTARGQVMDIEEVDILVDVTRIDHSLLPLPYELTIEVRGTNVASVSVQTPSGATHGLVNVGFGEWLYSSNPAASLAAIAADPQVGFGNFAFTFTGTNAAVETVTVAYNPGSHRPSLRVREHLLPGQRAERRSRVSGVHLDLRQRPLRRLRLVPGGVPERRGWSVLRSQPQSGGEHVDPRFSGGQHAAHLLRRRRHDPGRSPTGAGHGAERGPVPVRSELRDHQRARLHDPEHQRVRLLLGQDHARLRHAVDLRHGHAQRHGRERVHDQRPARALVPFRGPALQRRLRSQRPLPALRRPRQRDCCASCPRA